MRPTRPAAHGSSDVSALILGYLYGLIWPSHTETIHSYLLLLSRWVPLLERGTRVRLFLRFRDGNELEGLGPGSWFGRPAMLTCRVRFPTTAHVKERWENRCRGFHSAGVFTVVAPNVPPLHRNLLGVGLRQCDGGETFFSLTVVMLCDMTPPRKLAADRTRRAALAPAALLARRRDSDFARCSFLSLFERQRLPVPRVQRPLLLRHRFPLCQWVLQS
jgi:hypothetical protein